MSSSWLLLHFPTTEWGLCGGASSIPREFLQVRVRPRGSKCTAAPSAIHNFKTAPLIRQSWANCLSSARGGGLAAGTCTGCDLRWEERIPFLLQPGELPHKHTHARAHTHVLHKSTCLLEQVASHVMTSGMQIREKPLLMSKYLPLDLNLLPSSDAVLGRMAPR